MNSSLALDTSATRNEPNTLIRASAGTGKTYKLAIRYISLLHAGAEPEFVLATTFTRKAAGEILNRVLTRLSNAVLDETERGLLRRDIQLESLDSSRCEQMLQTMIGQLHRLQICTLDSFFSRLASTFSLELGLPVAWSMVDESQQDALRNRAVETLLQQGSIDESVQMASLLAKGRADRSVNALMQDVIKELYSIYQQTDAAAWCAVSAPQRLSADSLATLVDRLEAAERPEKTSWTNAINKDVERIRMRDWQSLIKGGIAAKILQGEDVYSGSEIVGEVRAVYQQLIRQAGAELVGQVVGQTQATWALLRDFDAIYETMKRETGVLRFDDITHALVRLSAAFDDGGLSYRLDSQLRHLLLDEFQDTSLEQWRVLQPFVRRVNQPDSDQSFFCVGDVKQAIYGWRGGVAEIFDDMEQQLEGLQVESMNVSYRSAPVVIDTVNRVFGGLTRHPQLDKLAAPVAAWDAAFEEHHAHHADRPGQVRLVVAPLAVPAESSADAAAETQTATNAGKKKKASKPQISKAEQEQATLKYAADYIADLVVHAPGRSVGVLARSNAVVAKLMFELRILGVPASEEGGNPLTDSAAVQCVMSALRLADHPGDSIARFHVLHSPLGPVLGLQDAADDTSAVECARRIRRQLMQQGYGPTLEDWYLQIRDRGTPRDTARLQQLVQLAYEFQAQATLRPSAFLKRIETQTISSPSVDSVRVMTIHQAKGLQFDSVVLAELESGIGGSSSTCVVGRPQPTADANSVIRYCAKEVQRLLPPEVRAAFVDAESRRVREDFCVMYVAMTRAVHSLHMIVSPATSAKQRTQSGFLCATLAPDATVAAEAVLFESGAADWAEHVPQPPTLPPVDAVPIDRVALAPMDSPRRRSLRRTAPSSLEGSSRVAAAQLFGTHSTVALRKGTLIHHWCEHLTWLDAGLPDVEHLRSWARSQQATAEEIDVGLTDWQAMLERPALRRLLTRDSYQDPGFLELPPDVCQRIENARLRVHVETELPIAVRDDDCLVSGTIDRLVLVYADEVLVAAEVIDFKTDRISEGDSAAIEGRVAYYRGQLDSYRWAVGRVYGLEADCINCRLAFLMPGVVARV